MKFPKTLIIVNLIKSMGIKLLLIMAIMSLASNCSKDKIWKDDELSLKKVDYTGNQIRIDGYYYQIKDDYHFDIYFFYNNGIIIAAGGVFNSIIEMNEYINNEFLNDMNYQNYKSNWGVFNINKNIIQFERWYPSDPPLKAYIRAGTILNDTTFHITESYRMKDGEKTEIDVEDEIYHFKQLSPKPDSTNSFVE